MPLKLRTALAQARLEPVVAAALGVASDRPRVRVEAARTHAPHAKQREWRQIAQRREAVLHAELLELYK